MSANDDTIEETQSYSKCPVTIVNWRRSRCLLGIENYEFSVRRESWVTIALFIVLIVTEAFLRRNIPGTQGVDIVLELMSLSFFMFAGLFIYAEFISPLLG
jgi:hypothetical protein